MILQIPAGPKHLSIMIQQIVASHHLVIAVPVHITAPGEVSQVPLMGPKQFKLPVQRPHVEIPILQDNVLRPVFPAEVCYDNTVMGLF